jgi:ATP-binding cassette subfamily B multidrug efflux pump
VTTQTSPRSVPPAPGAKGPSGPSRGQKALDKFHEEGAMGKAYDGRLLRRLWPYVKPHARYLVLSLGTLVVIAAVNLLRPMVMGDVVRRAAARDPHGLLRDGLILAGLLAVAQALNFVQLYSMQVAGARAMADLRTTIFRFFQGLRLRYYDKTPVGRLVTRATNDVDAVSELFASSSPRARSTRWATSCRCRAWSS